MSFSNLFSKISVCILLCYSTLATAQTEGKALYVGQYAPSFFVKDIMGDMHSIEQYKGKKILLSFYRHVACPVCNLRFHELEAERDYFAQKGIVLLAIYESSPENMQRYIDTNHYYQKMIPNPDADLYELYGVEESRAKLMKGVMKGALKKAKKGKELFANKLETDGSPNRIAADFLINEEGNILIAYYGRFLGDRLPIDLLKKTIEN